MLRGVRSVQLSSPYLTFNLVIGHCTAHVTGGTHVLGHSPSAPRTSVGATTMTGLPIHHLLCSLI